MKLSTAKKVINSSQYTEELAKIRGVSVGIILKEARDRVRDTEKRERRYIKESGLIEVGVDIRTGV